MNPNKAHELFDNTLCVNECPDKTHPAFIPIYAYDSKPMLDRYCLPDSNRYIELFFDASGADKLGQYLADLYLSWKVLLISVFVALVLALIYMLIIRLCAAIVIWVTLIAYIVFLAVIGYLFYNEYTNAIDDGEQLNYLVCAILIWCFDGLFLLMIFCMYNDIQMSIAIIVASAKFIFSNFFILLLPPIAIIITAGYLVYWIASTLYVYSIGDITQDNGTPFSAVKWKDTTHNLWYYQLVALVWIVAFFISVIQFIVAATAAQWYFSYNNDQGGSGSVCKSFYWVVRYHLGSLGFGSLILTLVVFVRFIFEYMKQKVLENKTTNTCTKCLLCCASCCLRCIGEFILYMTKNAYIQVRFI